jgi:transcription factor SFP1
MPAPIDITSRPHQSGQQPKSNLTSQLRAAGAGMAVPMNESYGARSGSITHGNALPMSNPRLRRESMANGDLARSLLNNGGGTSWGGVSVGSWIKDE